MFHKLLLFDTIDFPFAKVVRLCHHADGNDFFFSCRCKGQGTHALPCFLHEKAIFFRMGKNPFEFFQVRTTDGAGQIPSRFLCTLLFQGMEKSKECAFWADQREKRRFPGGKHRILQPKGFMIDGQKQFPALWFRHRFAVP